MDDKQDTGASRQEISANTDTSNQKRVTTPYAFGEYANFAGKVVFTSAMMSIALTPLFVRMTNIYAKESIKISFAKQCGNTLGSNIKSGQIKGGLNGSSKHFSSSEIDGIEGSEAPSSMATVIETAQTVGKSIAANPTAQAVAWSQVDLALSSYHSNKGFLESKRISVPKINFKSALSSLKGVQSVASMALGLKCISGFVNFGSLLVGQDIVKSVLPKPVREHKIYGETVSGAISGGIGAMVNFPINHAVSRVMATAIYDKHNNRIVTDSCLSFFKQEIKQLTPDTFKNNMKEFFSFAMRGALPTNSMTKGPLPTSIAISMTAFAILNAVNASLGENPLDDAINTMTR
ncbi:MAG: hypothetical protein P1U74_04195 [Legionellaceae bacterium]|nr:hypothetical protein [Legionellaceae bacterium]